MGSRSMFVSASASASSGGGFERWEESHEESSEGS